MREGHEWTGVGLELANTAESHAVARLIETAPNGQPRPGDVYAPATFRLLLAALTLVAGLPACGPKVCAVQDDLIVAHPSGAGRPAGRRIHRCDGKPYLQVDALDVGRCRDFRGDLPRAVTPTGSP